MTKLQAVCTCLRGATRAVHAAATLLCCAKHLTVANESKVAEGRVTSSCKRPADRAACCGQPRLMHKC